MPSKELIYLQYIKEFDCYGMPKSVAMEAKQKGIITDIRLPEIVLSPNKDKPLLGFLFGQDTSADGTEYYTISQSYLQALLNTGANLRFLDYENPVAQAESCHGIVLPGGNFDFPEEYFIKNENLGTGIGKRFLAYQAIIEKSYLMHKPMLGICAGAQMLGAVLGNMKMYLHITEEVGVTVKHKPTAKGEICMHELKIFDKTPILDIMHIKSNDKVEINSRHEQAMVLNAFQKGKPRVEMEMYAVCLVDNIPEIWGNDKENILCVQGHPEDLAAAGDKRMQSLYNYVAERARICQSKND